MVETGAIPKISRTRKQFLRLARVMTNPLRPDDYLALVNPKWSARESTGTVVRLRQETDDCTTVVIKPDFRWESHRSGQYLRIGLEINGIRHWRAYTITSDPAHPEGVISVTVKHTEGGKMSPVFNRYVQPGHTVYLGEVEGEFTLDDQVPDKLLFLSAGSGITPIMSMLRELERRDAIGDSLHVHSCRTADDMIFGRMLRRMARRQDGYTLREIHTADEPRFDPLQLDELCPDWREREVYLSGPRDMMDAVEKAFADAGRTEHLHQERFQPVIGNGGGEGKGGKAYLRVSDCEATCDTGTSILVGAEKAGAKLQFGCRMGICHTCVGRLQDGAVRDLRTGAIEKASGQMIRVCVSAPEGDIEIDL